MGKLIIKDKDIVVPGETLAQGMDYLPGRGTHRDGENIIASHVGLVNISGRAIKLVPMAGRYIPKKGDTVIAKITDILMTGWRIDINCAYSAIMSMKDATSEFIARGSDLSRYHKIGDYLMASVTNVTSQNLIDISLKGPGLRKLYPGRIINISPSKVPRVIGKKGSMVSMIKLATNTRVMVGQNGLVWLSGEDPKLEIVAVNTIKKIEREAHLQGLTEKIKEFLEKETGKKITLNVEGGPQ